MPPYAAAVAGYCFRSARGRWFSSQFSCVHSLGSFGFPSARFASSAQAFAPAGAGWSASSGTPIASFGIVTIIRSR